MITLEDIAPKYMRAFGKRVVIKDASEQIECNVCSETPGKVYEDLGWDDEGTSQTGRFVECSTCEGTGWVDVPVTINRV